MQILENEFCYFPNVGIGFYPVGKDRPYNKEYFDRYYGYSKTSLGEKITQSRINLIRRHYVGKICDIGIGSGHFLMRYGYSVGYDVNPTGVQFLKSIGKYADPYKEKFKVMTFWDSLEHIDEPDKILKNCLEYCFVTIPIFRDLDDILTSKHYRPKEHIWYFTENGIIRYFESQGFDCIETNNEETRLGRESIKSYAFKKKKVHTS